MIKHLTFLLITILILSCHSYTAISSTSLEDVANGNCTIIDLTYPLNKSNAYWPAPSYTPFTYKSVATLKDNADYKLTVADIIDWEKVNGRIHERSIILPNTDWSSRWNNYEKYKNVDGSNKLHFPGYSADAADFLVNNRDTNGIGIDTLSADCGISTDFSVHNILNGSSKYILENVANLDKLPPTGATLIIAPIKIEGGSGGQTRIWAILTRP